MPTYGHGESPVWSGEVNYDDKYSGTLCITNRRLLFAHRVGIVRRREILAADIPLKDITSTSVEIGPWNWIVLVIAARNQRHRFLFREKSPDLLIKRINDLASDKSTVSAGPTS